MPRYIVQCAFPEGLQIRVANGEAEISRGVIERTLRTGVTWLSSFVSEDKTRTFYVYDAPTPEAIRKTSARDELLIEEITQVRVVDPYFYA